MELSRVVGKIIAPLARRVRLMVSRAIITLVDDSVLEQEMQIGLLAGEVRAGVERYQEYGFTSVPHQGAEAVVVFAGGNRDHGLIIATGDRRYRLKELSPGEVALYDDQGQKVHFKRGEIVEIVCNQLLVKATTKVRFETPLVEATTDIIDRCESTGLSMHSMRGVYDGHTHNENDNGGPTDNPNQQMN